MKEGILKDLQDIIDNVSYGDITRNDLESKLASLYADIEEHLID